MNTPTAPVPLTAELDALEAKVARRADELAAVSPTYGSMRLDVEIWLRAEREALDLANAETIRVLPQQR